MKNKILFTKRAILSLTLIFTLAFTACNSDNNAYNEQNKENSVYNEQSKENDITNQNKENGAINQNNKNSENEDNEIKDAEKELKVEDFFPFQKDVYMKYKGIGNEYAEYETYVEFINGDLMQIRNLNPGTNAVMVYEIKDGELRLNFIKGEVYYRHDFTNVKDDDRLEILIKEPIKKGTAWTLKDGTKRSITEVNKEISTPLGNFLALEITSENERSIIKDYYVKDIGHVKRIFTLKDGDYTVTSELEKIEKGVPLKETIKFFYPDFLNDRLVYINKEVELYTNQDIKSVIEEKLKNVPENSQLTKPLSENTRLLYIIIEDPMSDIIDHLVVDFSKELVTEMNAGSSLEGMILQSITNTFCRYYQTAQVQITLEGNLYESGHFLLKPDEYFTVDLENSVEYK
ncbi:MAG TPA: GerMN domain-containing protein [Clostridiaceae bacterium]|nr:GerMN domain-containing protein [Clostridiaceae bacterium]